MADQTVILVDKKDKFLGYAPKIEAHTGLGKHHRAFVTLLFDSENYVILHRRKHRLFDGLWDLTAISHPLHLKNRDESYQEASDRALFKEMGIKGAEVENVGAFNYFAKDGKNCENEYCSILVGKYDGKFRANKETAYEAKKVRFEDFIADISKNPKKYTPWAVLAAKQFQGTTKHMMLRSHPETFESEINDFLKIFEPYAKKYFDKKIKDATKYSPLISRFYKDLADFSKGGKRLRAFLVWLGYEIGRGGSSYETPRGASSKKILDVCLAFEIAHSFLLIHDDIIDQSDTRRGKPTVHKRYQKDFGVHYGNSQAILMGDIACLEAIKLVGNSEKVISVLLETIYGEAMDVEFANRRPKYADILKMTQLKTAKYTFVGPLIVGAILADADSSQLRAIEQYGMNVGLAYQLQDDILGVFGDEKVTGKSSLSDMREGKSTLLINKVQSTRVQKYKELKRIWGNAKSGTKDLEEIRKLIKESGALGWCEAEKARLIKLAKSQITKIAKDTKIVQVLEEVADFAANRDK
ncbi:MAG TPA: polyprenyl synthetase family protein [Candidatus Saccharimonadales bacterium]|nr:polyprenyl synthetase family protein [Candidatus Saccharimonadales bacterium]